MSGGTVKKLCMKKIGVITQEVIDILHLACTAGTPIFLGESNIKHMQEKHEYDFLIYGDDISLIIAKPDYIALNKDKSIEYVKEYQRDNEFVKVAVKVNLSGNYFARTLYVLNSKRVQDFIAKGTLKKI